MKKIILLFSLIFIAYITCHAQGVKFESGTLSEMLTKAKAENKTIFIDVYTKWCGPCKHVSENVFPQEKLGEYYNSRFINYKIDAESPAGKEFVKNYPVTGYPTFFFIDGSGRVIHKVVGAKDVDGFIAEAKMVSMYARYGGIDNMMTAIKNGTADRELLFDYYQSANPKNKPTALNLYLKALPTEELIDVNNKLIDEISLYDKDLLIRLIDEIVKFSHTEKYSDKKFVQEYSFNIVFPVQYTISTFLKESIEKGNQEWFNELLQLKARFANYAGRLLDGDLKIIRGRGVFFATPEYNQLCFWTKNRVHPEEFKKSMVTYMDNLIRSNHVDSLLKEDKNLFLKGLKKGLKETENTKKGELNFFVQKIIETGEVSTQNIIDWTEYFWRISPSDKKTRDLCRQWINYAFNLNRFNFRTAISAADLLARIGSPKDAKSILEKAIASQKEIKNGNPKLLKTLDLKLRDVNNGKL